MNFKISKINQRNYLINSTEKRVELKRYISDCSRNLRTGYLKNSLLGLAVLGVSSFMTGCSKVTDVNEITPVQKEITNINTYFEQLGLCLDDASFENVNTISIKTSDGTDMYLEKTSYGREGVFFLCKNVYAQSGSDDYTLNCVRNKDGFTIHKYVSGKGRSKYKLVKNKDNSFEVFKYDAEGKEIPTGTLLGNSKEHKLVYKSIGGTRTEYNVIANNEEVPTNRNILVNVTY